MQCFSYLFLVYLLISHALSGDDLASPVPFDRLTFHQGPAPLAKESTTNDWPRFNGPNDNAISVEEPLIKKWLPAGPTLLWEVEKGEGYSSPGIQGERLVLFHRLNGKETVECLHPENGKRYWSYDYPVEYRDRYGYSNGPRTSPVIDEKRVYLHGVTAWLTCLNLETGKLIWKRNLAEEFAVPEYFFGKGSNPIVAGDKLILNIGGSEDRCVVAFDKKTGKQAWIAKDSWGASYSSPTLARIHDKEVCLVLTGGESRPPKGGLLVLDPNTGEKLARFPWRADKFESANAVPPLPVGKNRVFLSECYELGGVLLEFNEKFIPKVLWKKPDFNIHWMTPILSGNHLYGVSGRHQQGSEMVCVELDTGKEVWRNRIAWEQDIQGRKLRLEAFRASLLYADGHYLCLSELGSLLWLDLSPKGSEILSSTQLFFASGTWTLPAVSRGLLYVMQNETDRMSNTSTRILCYDLRKN
jgi:outer membrane protein assembly factor BamB